MGQAAFLKVEDVPRIAGWAASGSWVSQASTTRPPSEKATAPAAAITSAVESKLKLTTEFATMVPRVVSISGLPQGWSVAPLGALESNDNASRDASRRAKGKSTL